MKRRHLVRLAAFGLKTILFRLKKPILGTIIVTDYCNLSCKHCAVNNINKVMFSFARPGTSYLSLLGAESLGLLALMMLYTISHMVLPQQPRTWNLPLKRILEPAAVAALIVACFFLRGPSALFVYFQF